LVLSGQKCSALSRLYVASSVWNQGFKDQLLDEVVKIKVGPPQDWSSFMGPVMYDLVFDESFPADISSNPADDQHMTRS